MENLNERRQRCRTVRKYVNGLEDSLLRTVCFLFMNGMDSLFIRRELGVSAREFNKTRQLIASGLLAAGFVPRGA